MFNDAPCLAGGVAGVNDRGRFRLASGLSSDASARGPSWFRVRPVAKSLEFIHYNSPEYLFSSAQATRRAKSMRFSSLGSQAVQMHWETLVFFFPAFLNQVNFQSLQQTFTSLYFAC